MNTTERKKAILEAAFALIADQGIQELTIKNLAKAVGVSEPALYRHFDSKASILSAIADEIISIRDKAWQTTLLEARSAPECLESFFLRQARSFESLHSLVIILYPDMLFKQDPDLLGRIRFMIEETKNHIIALLDQGIAEGVFRNDLDTSAVSSMLIGGFRVLVSEWRMNRGNKSFSLVQNTRKYMNSVFLLISTAQC